jgi:hypothetical protein
LCRIPRFVEYVCRIASNAEREEGCDHRDVLLERLRRDTDALFVKYLNPLRWNDFCLSAVFAFGSGFVVSDSGIAKRDYLFTEGFLHPLSSSGDERAFGVAPLLFELLAARVLEYPLLAAVLEFLRYDMVGAEGQRFEEQLEALFRILSVAREEMVKREDLFFGSREANDAKLS